MGSPLCDHMARLCIHCDCKLKSESVNKYDHSRIPLCNKYVSDSAVQCFQQGLCLPYLDIDSTFWSSPSSFSDCSRSISLPLYNEDLSSYFETFQTFKNFTKNYSDQQMTLLQPPCLDIPKNSLGPGFNGYETKIDIDNVFVNAFDGDKAVLDQKELIPKKDLFPLDQLIDEITKHNGEITPIKILASSPSGMSSGLNKDYNVEALANASSQDYYKNQVIGSLAKEETSKFGIFPNAFGQLDCGQSQFILADEILKWEKSKKHILREEGKKRYLAKKKNRKYGKQIRYVSRKSTADTKRRMKGRFTKVGEEYDYDPRTDDKIMSKI